MIRRLAGLVTAIVVATMASTAWAQSPQDFYRDRQITLIVGSEAGAGFDIYARLLSRYLGKHLGNNARFIVQNQPGAGSLTMINSVVNTGPKDGTVIGAPQAGAAMERLFHLVSPEGKAAQFDSVNLNWLGTMSQDVFTMFGWHKSQATSLAALKATTYSMGVAGPNTDGFLIGKLMNRLLGTKLNIVTGYPGAAAELLALERGEIDAAPMSFASAVAIRPTLLKDKFFPVLLQMGAHKHADLPDVPRFEEIVPADQREVLDLIFAKYQIGRPFFVAPGVPDDRVAFLRAAFDATLADPELLDEAKKMSLEIDPLGGARVQAIFRDLYGKPDALVRQARDFLGTK
jgi:tripartite-type tricarboxylate transporter receptor subunit TctC